MRAIHTSAGATTVRSPAPLRRAAGSGLAVLLGLSLPACSLLPPRPPSAADLEAQRAERAAYEDRLDAEVVEALRLEKDEEEEEEERETDRFIHYDAPHPASAQVESVEVVRAAGGLLAVVARGTHPDPCTTLRDASGTRQGHALRFALPSWRDPGTCPAEGTPFETEIPLDVRDLETGHYTVTVNGVRGEFDLPLPSVSAD